MTLGVDDPCRFVASGTAPAQGEDSFDFSSAAVWNNLGVLYSRVNRLGYSSSVFLMAIETDDNTYSARSNLARVYRQQGKLELAATMAASVDEFRMQNPYYHQSLAAQKLNSGEYRQAIVHLEYAVARKHNEQYFYHVLAVTHQKLGDDEPVVENLSNARRYARDMKKNRFLG
ncbi:MAG: hypothetical protein JKY86_07355, partial [Gammaproteobacteria bacterium]|nr:hypothetical protein [Gammaproteobacteria bacterium]